MIFKFQDDEHICQKTFRDYEQNINKTFRDCGQEVKNSLVNRIKRDIMFLVINRPTLHLKRKDSE